MALFAEKDGTGRVLRVVVCDSAAWLESRLGGTWVETTDANPAKQYAGIGMYDSVNIAPRQFIPPWAQPQGAHDAYATGDWVWHSGKAWRNLTPANTFAPGVSGWREMLTEWPQWVQPAGSQDAYQIGEKITFEAKRYISAINANVWSPTGYPQGWTLQT